MTASGIHAINPALYAKMAFDPIKDLEPVAALVSLSNVLVVHPSVKVNSVAVNTARARCLAVQPSLLLRGDEVIQ